MISLENLLLFVPLAAILEGKTQPGSDTVLICSGGNIDQKVLLDCLNA